MSMVAEAPRPKPFLVDFIQVVLMALVLYVVIQFAVQTIHVIGPSMENTLQTNDYLIASKISYRLHAPQRGDIVVFKPSTDATHDYIKRIIGLPGDHIRIQDSHVFINGHLLEEPYLRGAWTWQPTWHNGVEEVVPPAKYFVMGDNRNESTDSRSIGYQSLDAFLGKAWVRIWPLSQFRVFSAQQAFAN